MQIRKNTRPIGSGLTFEDNRFGDVAVAPKNPGAVAGGGVDVGDKADLTAFVYPRVAVEGLESV